MRDAPVQALAPQVALRAADILDREASAIVRSWLERLKAEAPARPSPCLQDLQAQGVQLMNGIGEALRLGRPPAGAPWLAGVRRHAELHVAQGVSLGSVLHEYRVLWEEIRRSLQARSGDGTARDALALAGPLEGASDAVAEASSAAYDAAARRALEEAEIARRRLEAVLDQMPSGVIISEAPSGRLILANKEVERIWRHPFWRSADVDEYKHWEIYHLDGRPFAPEETALARSVRRGEVVAAEEEKIRRGDGTWGIVLTRATPIRDAEGRVIAGVLVFDDITERKQLEQALQDSERFAHAVLDALNLEVAVLDETGSIAVVNKAWLDYARANGAALDRVGPGVSYRAVCEQGEAAHAEGAAEFCAGLRAVMEGQQEQFAMDYRFPTPTELRWFLGTVRRFAPPGQAHIVVSHEDITERKRAEEERERLLAEVRRRVAELDVTITAVADGLIISDPHGAIVRINPAAAGITGYSAVQMRWPYVERAALLRAETADGTPVAPQDQPPARALRGETVQGQTLVVHRASDGRPFWISTSAAPIYAPNGRMLGSVVTFSDITARHELEEQRNDILRAVSHDLRNPLATVQGQAQLLLRLLDKSGHDAAERAGVEAILTGARRMNTMIQDLVDSARSESGQLKLKPQPVDLPSFARNLLQRQANALDTARVRIEPAEGLPQVYADPDLLERILVNLLSNALKYSDPGTEVTVHFEPRGNTMATLVIDRGRGIPPEDMPRLFQRYYRVEGGREGLGLGLYITRTFVEAHGGRIWAESQVGQGSTFTFTLPIVPQGREREG